MNTTNTTEVPPGSITVVAVDDDPDVLEAISAQVKTTERLRLIATGVNGRDALQLANRLRPDVMILDVRMPVLNGLEAAARINACYPNISILMLTSESDNETIKEALRAGARDFLSKLTDLGRIAHAILNVYAKRRPDGPPKGDGFIWGFYSPKGGAGTTTLAVNTAIYLTQLEYKVLVIDLDMLNGDCAFQLDVTQKSSKETLLYQISELPTVEHGELLRYTNIIPLPKPHDKVALHLLPSPCTFVPSGEHAEQNFHLLLQYAQMDYDYVIVDLPPGSITDRLTAHVLDVCERVFISATRDIAGMKALIRLTELLMESAFPIRKLSVVLSSLLNHPGFDSIEFFRSRETPIRDVLEMPLDRPVCARSLKSASPVLILEPTCEISGFVKELVEISLNLQPIRDREKLSIWHRLMNNFKRLLARA
jgi:pilus assembly protein CpaE